MEEEVRAEAATAVEETAEAVMVVVETEGGEGGGGEGGGGEGGG